MAVDVFLSGLEEEVSEGVPLGAAVTRALGEAELADAVGGAGGEAVAHGGEAPMDLEEEG